MKSYCPILAAVLLLAIAGLTALAYASPPDPSWIRGIYDDGDFDDVVVLLTSTSSLIDVSLSPRMVMPILSLVGRPVRPDDTARIPLTFSPLQRRAPPHSSHRVAAAGPRLQLSER